MRIKPTGLRWLAVAAASTMALTTACSGSGGSADSTGANSTSAAAQGNGGTVRIAADISGGTLPITFDPIKTVTPGATLNAPWLLGIYGTLLRHDSTTGKLVPDLAAKASVDDPKTVSIDLRPNLVFSDGTPMDAEAVKAGIERNKNAERNTQFDAAIQSITSIEIGSPTSLVIHLSKPVAGRIYELLANKAFMIVSPSAKDPANKPIGAGPYTLQQFERSQKLVLKKNPKYWDAKDIGPQTIEVVNVSAGPQQVNSLKADTVDVSSIPLNSVEALKSDPSLHVITKDSSIQGVWVGLCPSYKPLGNVKVRQALNYAVNRKQIVNSLLEGMGKPAWSLYPQGDPLYNDTLTGKYAYNIDKAKQLMREAGYPNGFKLTVIPLPGTPLATQVSTVLQQEWKKIGVDLTIKQSTNYHEDFSINKIGQASTLPSYGLTGVAKLTHYTPTGVTCSTYDDPEVNKLTAQLTATQPGTPAATELWKQVQAAVVDQAMAVWIAYQPFVAATDDKVVDPGFITAYGSLVLDYHTVKVKS